MSNLTKTQTVQADSKLLVTVWKGSHSSHREIRLNFISVEPAYIHTVWSQLHDAIRDKFNIHIPPPNNKLQVILYTDIDTHEKLRAYIRTLSFAVQWSDYSRM